MTMTRDELTARDELYLAQARDIGEAVIEKLIPPVYSSAWGRKYDPYALMGTTTDPGVFRLALMHIRIAVRPEESWGTCSHCSRLYLVESYGNTCSAECFAAHSHYLDNQQ